MEIRQLLFAIASRTFSLAVVMSMTTAPSFAEDYALLIGVTDNADNLFKTPRYAVNDVIELRDALVKAGYEDRNVVVMHDDVARKESTSPLLDPVAYRINRFLDLFLARKSETDTILLIFCGNTNERNSGQVYFYPKESVPTKPSTLVDVEEIYHKLEKCPAQKKLVIFNTIRNCDYTSGPTPADSLSVLANRQTSVSTIITTSPGKTTINDVQAKKSVFVSSLVQTIQSNRSDVTDANGDGDLSMREWIYAAQQYQKQYIEKNYPDLTGLTAASKGPPLTFNWILYDTYRPARRSTARPQGTFRKPVWSTNQSVAYALLIGIENYDETLFKRPEYAVNSVIDLRNALVKTGYDGERGVAIVMHDDESRQERNPPLLEPTANRINRLLDDFLSKRSENNTVLLVLCGYTYETTGGKAYFCPKNSVLSNPSTLVNVEELYKKLERCPAAHKLVIFDVCRRADYETGSQPPPLEVWAKQHKSVTTVITSSPGRMYLGDHKTKNSVFVSSLVETIQSNRNEGGDADGDGDLSTAEWIAAAREHHRQFSQKQFRRQFARTTETYGRRLASSWILYDKYRHATKPRSGRQFRNRTHDNPVVAGRGEKYALLIGVRQYDKNELRSLPYTENDITELSQLLTQSGYRKENVVLMTQTRGAEQARYLPLADNIRKELPLLLNNLTEDDSVIVALAGHGVQFEGEETNYFCPMDARLADRNTLVSQDYIYSELKNCRASFKLLLSDACRNDPQVSHARSRSEVNLNSITRPQQNRVPSGVAAFFSCSSGQEAFSHDRFRNGVFFHFVIEGLKGQADFDGDRKVALAELEIFTKKRVSDFVRAEYGKPQMPEFKGEVQGLPTVIEVER